MKKDNLFLLALKKFLFLIIYLIVISAFAWGGYEFIVAFWGNSDPNIRNTLISFAILYFSFCIVLYKGLEDKISGKQFTFDFILFIFIIIILSISFLLMKLSIV